MHNYTSVCIKGLFPDHRRNCSEVSKKGQNSDQEQKKKLASDKLYKKRGTAVWLIGKKMLGRYRQCEKD